MYGGDMPPSAQQQQAWLLLPQHMRKAVVSAVCACSIDTNLSASLAA
jgi:hypothetical protein